jgi:serine/threonine protein kinase/tetratricopeptide (TPR) repeat protein
MTRGSAWWSIRMISQKLDEEAIFKVAREINSSEAQALYLQQVCGDNSELRHRVSALLRVQAEQPGFLESPAAEIFTVDRPVTEQTGGRIGPYKLLQELGEGGMGVVFMAEQTDPVERRVALKLIKPGMDTRQVIARFEAERQALALMDHPSIAKVLDAGTTDSGRPFFVMELVRGVPITEYCDQHQLTPRQRLEIFVPVCHAVQHAHQKGVIHRDLKPSNVLVAEYDEEPVAKIIDFGVVKAIGQRLTEKTMFTQVGQLVGTIDYMSPEQAKLNQLDVDTRTDIYSLGVLLYELLTGETPFERKRLHAAALDEMLRIIREEEPPRPSTRLSSSGTLPSIAAQRHTEPKLLTNLVRGELDWIVMKALDKDRSRRYQTANALAMDVQRYLADEPVLACPPSAAYRFRKLARRNKAALLAAVLVAVALIVGTVASTWQAVRATRAERMAEAARAAEAEGRQATEMERNEAEKQREQANANLQKARAAVDESFTMVSESKLLDVPGLQPLRKDLLEAALRFYRDFAFDRSSDPRVMADVAATYLRIGQINSALDRNDDAIVAVRQALDIIDQLRREHPSDSESQRRLAGFCTDRRWAQKGTVVPKNPLAAFQTLLRLEAMWEKLAAEHPTTIAFQTDLAAIDGSIGVLLHWSGNEKAGSKYLQKAVAIGEKMVRADPAVPQYRSALADVSLQLAANQSANGLANEALALTRRAAELREGLVAEYPQVPAYRAGLAASLVGLGDRTAREQPQLAEQSYRRAIALAQSLLDEFPGHQLYLENWTVAGVQLATFEFAQHNYAKAEEVLQEIHQGLESRVAARSKERNAREGMAFGCFYIAQRVPALSNQAAITESLYRLALILFAELADEFPEVETYAEHTAHCHQHLGWNAFHSNRLDEALVHYESAVEQFEKLITGQTAEKKYAPFLNAAYRTRSDILDRQNKLPEALAAAESAVRLAPNNTDCHVRLLGVLNRIDISERRQETLSLLKPLLDIKPNDAKAWQMRGQVHAALGQTDEAAADFIQAINLSEDQHWWFSPRKNVCRELAAWSEVFEKVAERRPEETTLWIGRAHYRALRGQWADAAADYAKVIHTRPLSDESFEYAALLLLLEDRPRYQQFCQELIARTVEPHGMEAYYLAWICSIGPAAGVDASRFVDWANRGLGDRPPWTLTVLALAECRASQFELAIKHYQESMSLPDSEHLRPRNLFGLAMAHHRLGQMDAAHGFLEEARQLFQQAQPAQPGGTPLLDVPCEWLEQHVFSREVESLVQSSLTSAGEAVKDR